MMRTPPRISARLAWLVAPIAATLGCIPHNTVCATVGDCASGQPIEGVHVRFDLPTTGYGGDTDSTGTYCAGDLDDPPPDTYTIDVSKAGFQDDTAQVHGGSEHTDVCMAPLMCIPNSSSPCDCGGGVTGTQVCNDDGSALSDCAPCGAAADAGAD
jgi:hypothetical protein